MGREREGSGRRKKPVTKTRRKLLSWFFHDLDQGHTLVHTIVVETEVVLVANGVGEVQQVQEDESGLQGSPVEVLPLRQRELPFVDAYPRDGAWEDTESPEPVETPAEGLEQPEKKESACEGG